VYGQLSTIVGGSFPGSDSNVRLHKKGTFVSVSWQPAKTRSYF